MFYDECDEDIWGNSEGDNIELNTTKASEKLNTNCICCTYLKNYRNTVEKMILTCLLISA